MPRTTQTKMGEIIDDSTSLSKIDNLYRKTRFSKLLNQLKDMIGPFLFSYQKKKMRYKKQTFRIEIKLLRSWLSCKQGDRVVLSMAKAME